MKRSYGLQAIEEFQRGNFKGAIMKMRKGVEFYAGRMQGAINGTPEPDCVILAAAMECILESITANFSEADTALKKLLMNGMNVIRIEMPDDDD